MLWLAVFVGAGLGGMARHAVSVAALRLLGPDAFPWGTLAVNVCGALVMGLVADVLIGRVGVSPAFRLLVTTGFLGGFTTFSTFSLETVLLWQRGEAGAAVLYAALSVALSLGALLLGLALARMASAA